MSDKANPVLLYGVGAIASHLGLTERQVRHRALQGQFPTFKIGRSVCALRETLDAWLAAAEAAARTSTAA